jgi:hypothetical protein
MVLKHRISTVAMVSATSLAFAAALKAQDAPPSYVPRFNVATYAGASIPTGNLRDAFDSALLLGAQGNYSLTNHLDVLGDFDWAHPSVKLLPSDTHANVYEADLGLEVGGARGNVRRWAMRPFADVGGGVRRYAFSTRELDDRTRGVGFAAVGTEVAFGRSAIRLAARDNIVSYAAPTADATHATRNDIGLTVGVGFHP